MYMYVHVFVYLTYALHLRTIFDFTIYISPSADGIRRSTSPTNILIFWFKYMCVYIYIYMRVYIYLFVCICIIHTIKCHIKGTEPHLCTQRNMCVYVSLYVCMYVFSLPLYLSPTSYTLLHFDNINIYTYTHITHSLFGARSSLSDTHTHTLSLSIALG
jgi:hypothetical protein